MANPGNCKSIRRGFTKNNAQPGDAVIAWFKPLDESFDGPDYTNIGSPVSSNTPANWANGGSTPNDLTVAPGSLSYLGLAASAGNSVTNGDANLARPVPIHRPRCDQLPAPLLQTPLP
jgi:hypothetical protein